MKTESGTEQAANPALCDMLHPLFNPTTIRIGNSASAADCKPSPVRAEGSVKRKREFYPPSFKTGSKTDADGKAGLCF